MNFKILAIYAGKDLKHIFLIAIFNNYSLATKRFIQDNFWKILSYDIFSSALISMYIIFRPKYRFDEIFFKIYRFGENTKH